jgi:TctA family transporter
MAVTWLAIVLILLVVGASAMRSVLLAAWLLFALSGLLGIVLLALGYRV